MGWGGRGGVVECVVEPIQGGFDHGEVFQKVGGGCRIVDVQGNQGAGNGVLGLSITDWEGKPGRGIIRNLLDRFLLFVPKLGVLGAGNVERNRVCEVFIEELTPVLGIGLSDFTILGAAEEGIWCRFHVKEGHKNAPRRFYTTIWGQFALLKLTGKCSSSSDGGVN